MMATLRRCGRDIAQFHNRLNDCWIGDLIGTVCIFGAGFGFIIIAVCMQ